jgi:hypothetical protein
MSLRGLVVSGEGSLDTSAYSHRIRKLAECLGDRSIHCDFIFPDDTPRLSHEIRGIRGPREEGGRSVPLREGVGARRGDRRVRALAFTGEEGWAEDDAKTEETSHLFDFKPGLVPG